MPSRTASLRDALAGRTLLVTGATGFLAKAFVAKVARDLPEVARTVVLIRERRRADGRIIGARERLEREVLGSSAFRRLRSELGDTFDRVLAQRVVAVSGDLTQPGLGLKPEDEELVASVDALVNSAATVVFDERLDLALDINTGGIVRLLELARRLGNAPVLHVSTAYVCGRVDGLVPEVAPSLDRVVADDLEGRAEGSLQLESEIAGLRAACAEAEQESRSAERLRRFAREGRLHRDGQEAGTEEARRRWLSERLVDLGMQRARERGWNDTYTYTKSLGERLLVQGRGSVPAAILRPSIIESSLAEPEPGWIDGLRMADPLFAAYGRGILKDFPADPASYIDFIPVDHVVNAMLASLAELVHAPPAEGAAPPTYHVATSDANPLEFHRLFELTRDYFLAHPLRNREGRAIVPPRWSDVSEEAFKRRLRSQRALLETGERLLGPLPSRLVSGARLRLARMKAQLDRVLYYVRIYRPYCAFPARFATGRTEALFQALPEDEQRDFGFDPRGFDWETYIQEVHVPGLLRNVLREGAGRPAAAAATAATSAAPEAADGENDGRTLLDVLATSAERYPDKVALQVRRDGDWFRLTYRDLHEGALATAALLAERCGVRRGDRVILQAENRPEWPLAWFGVVAAGATVVPLDVQAEPDRVRAVARVTEARVALLSHRTLAALGDTAGMQVVLLEDLAQPRLKAADAAARSLPVPLSGEAPASLLFTSGTTVEPKGVVLPHRSFLANLESIGQVLAALPEDRLVSVLPLHHAFEFTGGLLTPLSAGSTITYLESLSSQSIIDTLRETKATCLLGVPRLYELILEGLERQLAELGGGAGAALGALRGTSRLFSAVGLNTGRALLAPLHAKFGGSLRVLVCGGAALDPRVHDEFHALGFNLVEGYGLTECAPVLTVNPLDRSKAGSVGRPVPGVEIRIHRPGRDGVGEILARGRNVMSGYYKDREATERVLRDGWFHTGDLGRFDDEGYLAVTGRLKDLIVTGAGKNVYPDEVEGRLHDLPGVREACVVGARPKPGASEEVCLVAVLDAAATAAAGGEEAAREGVRRAVAERLASAPSHQRVQRIHFRSEDLPKTALLKVKRGSLRAELEQTLAGSSAKATRAATPSAAEPPAVREVLDLLARLTRSPRENLRRDQSLAFDLGVDSLMRVELVAALETRTGRPVPDEVAKDLSTVGDLADLARSLPATAAPSQEATLRATRPVLAPAVSGRSQAWLPRIAAPLARHAWPLLYRRWLGLDVHGRERLPKQGAYILAANHQSHLDSGAILTALGSESRRLHVVAARDYFFDTPWKGAFFAELLNAIPFDRHGDYEAGLEACRVALRAGDPLLIFPEGTRSPDGRLQEFKAGIGSLALELGVPVVPTRIDGTHLALPKGSHLPRRHRVAVTFGAPIDAAALVADGAADQLDYERWRQVAEAVRDGIASLGGEAMSS